MIERDGSEVKCEGTERESVRVCSLLVVSITHLFVYSSEFTIDLFERVTFNCHQFIASPTGAHDPRSIVLHSILQA